MFGKFARFEAVSPFVIIVCLPYYIPIAFATMNKPLIFPPPPGGGGLLPGDVAGTCMDDRLCAINLAVKSY